MNPPCMMSSPLNITPACPYLGVRSVGAKLPSISVSTASALRNALPSNVIRYTVLLTDTAEEDTPAAAAAAFEVVVTYPP